MVFLPEKEATAVFFFEANGVECRQSMVIALRFNTLLTVGIFLVFGLFCLIAIGFLEWTPPISNK